MSKIRDYINDIRDMLGRGVFNTGDIKSKLDDLDTELNEIELSLYEVAEELRQQKNKVMILKDKIY